MKNNRKALIVFGVFSLLLLILGVLVETSTARAGNVIGPGGSHGITEPGNYKVVGMVDSIGVAASNVHIDLSEGSVNGQHSFAIGIGIWGQENVHINGNLTGTVQNCNSFGIFVTGRNNHINGVVVENNGVSFGGDGIGVAGDSNKINGNISSNNGRFGIAVFTPSNDNRINGNTSLFNGNTDLFDKNGHCDNNKWRGNEFGTANPGCIK